MGHIFKLKHVYKLETINENSNKRLLDKVLFKYNEAHVEGGFFSQLRLKSLLYILDERNVVFTYDEDNVDIAFYLLLRQDDIDLEFLENILSYLFC